MHLTGVDRLFWALGLIGHSALLAVLLIRHRARSFPVFTALVIVNIIKTFPLYLVAQYGSSDAYFYSYWTLAIFDVALQLALAYELAGHVFKPLGVWVPDVRRSFTVLIALSILLAVGLTWLPTPPTTNLRTAVIIRADLFCSALLSELFVVMVALSVTLGLPWRTHVARLAQGFGVYAICGIFTDAAHAYFGTERSKDTWAMIAKYQIVLYILCLAYWIVTLARDEPKPRELPRELYDELRILQRKAALILRSLRTIGGQP